MHAYVARVGFTQLLTINIIPMLHRVSEANCLPSSVVTVHFLWLCSGQEKTYNCGLQFCLIKLCYCVQLQIVISLFCVSLTVVVISNL